MKTLRYISHILHRAALLLMLLMAGASTVWAQDPDPFPALNINNVRTRYKVVIYNPSTHQMQLHLFGNGPEVSAHCYVTPEEMAANGYVRWYLEDEDGNYIDFKDFTTSSPTSYPYQKKEGYGWWRKGFDTARFQSFNQGVASVYDPLITIPETYWEDEKWRNLKLVALVTGNSTGFTQDEVTGDLVHEPNEIKMKYVYGLLTVADLTGGNWPFIHYVGEGANSVNTIMHESPGIIGYDEATEYLTFAHQAGTLVPQQYVWDYEKNNYEEWSDRDIRQNVHYEDYYYFVDKPEGGLEELRLPIEGWDGSPGQEYRGYFRWYDYKTDMGTDYIVAQGGKLKNWMYGGQSYGLIGNINDDGTCSNGASGKEQVGAYFKVPAGFHSLNQEDEIILACDVSRFMDGRDESYRYFIHEPTLSMCIRFHILPARILVERTKQLAPSLESLEQQLLRKDSTEMPSILEYNGRTVVSAVADDNHFTLRTNYKQLQHYYIYDTGGNVRAANYVAWYALYVDPEDGQMWRKRVVQESRRLYKFRKDQVTTGTWTNVNTGETKNINVPWEHRVYAVACVGNSSYGGQATELPIVLTELEFVKEKPIELSIETETGLTKVVDGVEVDNYRSKVYMDKHYQMAKQLDFNGFTAFDLLPPPTSIENYMYLPLPSYSASYGFCYPQLFGLCATAAYGQGVSPMHGDYIMLKSINQQGISLDGSWGQSIYCNWWTPSNNEKLFDVTHERAHLTGTYADQKTLCDDPDYGYFLYVDASDEARTIAQLDFEASFCHSGKIIYSAYVSDLTVGPTKPMLRFRLCTYNTIDGSMNGSLWPGEQTLRKMPVVAFETGDIEEQICPGKKMDAAGCDARWYQVYGESVIPREFETILNGSPRHFYVEVDNFCDGTQGADYAVDEITFYTMTEEIMSEVNNDPCDDYVQLTVSTPAHDLIEKVLLNSTPVEGRRTLFYRIHELLDDDGDEVLPLSGERMYRNQNFTRSNEYGTVTINTEYDLSTVTSPTPVGGVNSEGNPDDNSGFFRKDGVVYFQLFDDKFNLEPGHTYYVSFYDMGYNSVGHPRLWGDPKKDGCSTFSTKFVPNKAYIELHDPGSHEKEDGNINFACGETEVTKTFDLYVNYPEDNGTFSQYKDLLFDFFTKTSLTPPNINAKQEFKQIHEVIDGDDIYLFVAISEFRTYYKAPITATPVVLPDINILLLADPSTLSDDEKALVDKYNSLSDEEKALIPKYKHIIEEWANHVDEDEGILLLAATNQFTYTFTESGERYFAALPVSKEVPGPNESIHQLCSPMDIYFKIFDHTGAPRLDLGFDDVKYPADYIPVVRMGLEQINDMKNKGYKLHIPVSSYLDKSYGHGNRLYFPVDTDDKCYLYLSGTNDPTVSEMDKVFVELLAPEGTGRPYVDPAHMYLVLDLSVCQYELKEGFQYEVSTNFYDQTDEEVEDSKRCLGDFFLKFKVVPEFITWHAKPVNGDLYSANWYNDDNWQRSVRSDLYKGELAADEPTFENHATDGHPNGYKNNSEMSIPGNNGFVPMKFSYVTMPTNNHAPSLIGEPKTVEGGRTTGGKLIDPAWQTTGTEMLTDTSPIDNRYSSAPTDNIRYDMLVRYGKYLEGGKGCHGHRILVNPSTNYWEDLNSDYSYGNADGDAKVYDVEKFYGNICKEIYFKPGAELLKQNRLTYEKAWVEKELTANKWYLMSTPLKNTYAGDMYVPVSATPTANGRQETEAFQNINFSTLPNDAGVKYSRTQYPIYQRTWGTEAKVYTKTDDVRKTDYSAQLNFNSVSAQMAEWGHTYNDVQVPYSDYGGFAIRAQRKDQKDDSDNDVPALLRLPKYDTKYDYYQWDNTSPTTEPVQQSVTKPADEYARLFDITADKQITWNLNNVQKQSEGEYTYYLLGNPFMSSLDMGVFFAKLSTFGEPIYYNEKFDRVYYTYEASTLETVDATVSTDVHHHIIKPMQAFFVRCRTADAPETVQFHTDMMIDGNYDKGTVTRVFGNGRRQAKPTFWIEAFNSYGSSWSSVSVGPDAIIDYDSSEDAMAFFDSNLADVPVVFTMAGEKAVSIDARPSLDLVPFGVACGTQNEPVDLKITDFAPLTPALYVLDAVAGTKTEVHDGQPLKVQPNDYGRYFLTTGDVTTVDNVDGGGIVISVRGRQLTVHATSNLKLARVLTTDGIIVNSMSDCGTDAVFNLTLGGIYVVEAETGEDRKVMTVVVR